MIFIQEAKGQCVFLCKILFGVRIVSLHCTPPIRTLISFPHVLYSCAAADDLMSLLDAGMHSAAAAADHSSGGAGVIIDSDSMFGDEMFSYSSLRARAANSSRQPRSGQ